MNPNNQIIPKTTDLLRDLMQPEIPAKVRQSRVFRVAFKKATKKAQKILGGRTLFPHELLQIEQEVAKYV